MYIYAKLVLVNSDQQNLEVKMLDGFCVVIVISML